MGHYGLMTYSYWLNKLNYANEFVAISQYPYLFMSVLNEKENNGCN